MEDEIFQQKFFICNIDQDGILGQDFLLKEIEKVNYKRMVLHTCQNKEIQCWIGGKANMICRVEVKETVIIPPMTSILLPVEIPGAEHLTESGYVECSSNLHPSILTVPGIIETNGETKLINVINHSDNEITLHKRQAIATCESYEEGNTEVEQVRLTTTDKIKINIDKEGVPEHLLDLWVRNILIMTTKMPSLPFSHNTKIYFPETQTTLAEQTV